MSQTVTRDINGKLRSAVRSLEPWFHNLHLPGGVQTAPGHYLGDYPRFQWNDIQSHIPKNLEGCTALDIGCNAGFYSFELAKRGAEVLGIDPDPHYLKQAKWAAKQLNLQHKVKFRQMQVYDLARSNRSFDIVLFMGVFHRLRYPMLALDIVTQKVKKMMIFQALTMPGGEVFEPKADISIDQKKQMLKKGWPLMSFIEKKLGGDAANWWAPNHSCILAMLRTCGFSVTKFPGHEMYIAEPDANLTSVANNWNNSEYLSAIGRDWVKKLENNTGH